MIRTRIITLVFLVLSLQPGAARAGEAESGPTMASVCPRIPPGKRIRLDVDGARYEGPFERFVADTLWFHPGKSVEPMAVPAGSIDVLWEHGSSAAQGALIGGGLLGAAGLALGLAVESDNLFDSESTSEPLLGAVAGVVSGALLGALIGEFIPHWHRKHP